MMGDIATEAKSIAMSDSYGMTLPLRQFPYNS